MGMIRILLGFVFLIAIACSTPADWYDDIAVFDSSSPQSLVFKKNLSGYNIYDGFPADLIPAQDFHLLELSSTLFTDYAQKQRLVKIPVGTQMSHLDEDAINFPNGTILVKTFYYYHDERDPSLGKRIIESRLLIKENDVWNTATYIWNQAQTDATLTLDGSDTQVRWININGNNNSIRYHIPNQNECFTCHQSNAKLTPLGPTLRNLNRNVERNEEHINHIKYLHSIGLLNDVQVNEVSTIADYKNLEASLSERARAYLAMNCAHCHNPSGWEKSSQRQFDFRYETPLSHTGILYKKEKILRTMMNGRMPFIGTTTLDEEGIDLITDYLNSL